MTKSVFDEKPEIVLGVTGGRFYHEMAYAERCLDGLAAEFNIKKLVEGYAPGLDTIARHWARKRKIPVQSVPANWKDGAKAGPMRNAEMAKIIDLLAAFPGNRGTASMKNEAKKMGVPIREF